MFKNIILTSANEDINAKGVITLENSKNDVIINLKTFNLKDTENKRILGVNIENKLFKVELDGSDKYKIEVPLNLNSKISVVIMEKQNHNYNILLWGSNDTSRVWQNSVMFDINKDEIKENDKTLMNNNLERGNYKKEELRVEKNDDFLEVAKNGQHELLNKQEKQEIKEKIEEEIFQTETKKEVKSYNLNKEEDEFESEEYIEELIDKNIENEFNLLNGENNEKNNKSEFLNSVKEQVEQLLDSYEEEYAIEELIPNSKFVKIDLNKNGEFYIFGVIYENDEIRYIVYGMPGEYSIKPDDEYSTLYQWLPLNAENPEGYGYYLMYQDAWSGSQVEMLYE